MRLVGAAMLACAAVPAAAQIVTAPPLAGNEVLLEVEGEGSVRRRADVAELTVPMYATGSTAALARAENDRLLARLRAAARSAGVAESDLQVLPTTSLFGFMSSPRMNLVQDADAEPEGEGELEAALGGLPNNRPSDARQLGIKLRDVRSYERVRNALEAAGATQISNPTFSLSNPEEARRAAKEEALKQARSQAEAYARNMGLRISRVVRVSERRPGTLIDVVQMAETMGRLVSGGSATPDIDTRATVSVDYVLAR